MKPETKNGLLRETLADDDLAALRRQSLDILLAAARQRRHRRGLMRAGVFAALPIFIIGMLWAHRRLLPPAKPAIAGSLPTREASSAPTAAGPPEKVKFITDDELFALFPGKPLALIGPPGQQRLVFLDTKQ